MTRFRWCGLFACILSPAALNAEAVPRVDFNRDIRPILSNVCFDCHGPDKNERKAELRLDAKDDVFKDRGGYSLVVPGKLEESELYSRLVETDEKLRMPPANALRQITKDQIGLIKRWIEQGAVWQSHWAYESPVRREPPVVKDNRGFVRNDVDRFVLNRLREHGLQPATEADRATLIRRLSFDLIGLPPTPAEVADFLSDKDDDAYEKVVDRLLNSPHFGERMAMFWLDLVRYADTNGYHGDNHEDRDLYRDWVIEAFNANMPFDRFTVEQLAGDLFPNATAENRIASGYNRLLMTTREGGAQAKEYLAKYSADRVRNFSAVWLAGTMGCCECHDHKYDPFTTRDFYSMAAFFADLKETAVGTQEGTKFPTPQESAQLAALDAQLAPLKTMLDTQTPELDAAQAAWEQTLRSQKVEWTIVRPAESKSQGGATLTVSDDGSVLVSGENPERDTYELTFRAPLKGVTGLRLEVLPDDSLPKSGPGRSDNGNFVLNEFKAILDGQPLEWSEVAATHSQAKSDVKGTVDGKQETGWGILDRTGRASHAVFELKAEPTSTAEQTLVLTLEQTAGSHRTIGRLRWAVTTAARPVRPEGHGLPPNVVDILAIDPAQRSQEQQQALAAYFRGIAPLLEATRNQHAALQKQRDTIFGAVKTTLVSMSGEPRMIRVLPRGNWLDDSGDEMRPAAPAFLKSRQAPVSGNRETRLDLAQWVVSPENPLTARVFVNRLWKIAFGQGLVKTVEDFGAQGTPPTHPDLLDWLALEFMSPDGKTTSPPLSKGGQGGSRPPDTDALETRNVTPPHPPFLQGGDAGGPWDVKRILKLLVMSGAYRQSSFVDEGLRQRDPYNHWLARQGRYRLDAEMVRDNALAVSGLLVHQLGGPSARPYQPGGYWAYLNFPIREWQADSGDGLYRRGVYTYWCRTFLHPSLKAFDAPTREECTADRPRSNTPLQALVLLNDPSYVEAARAFAERILRDGGATVESRIQSAYSLALSRVPRREETSLLTALVERHLDQYRSDPKAADALLHVGERPVPADINSAELAAWTSVARAIFNLHEMVTRN